MNDQLDVHLLGRPGIREGSGLQMCGVELDGRHLRAALADFQHGVAGVLQGRGGTIPTDLQLSLAIDRVEPQVGRQAARGQAPEQQDGKPQRLPDAWRQAPAAATSAGSERQRRSVPRKATIPIPTTIHRRLDEAVATRKLGTGRSHSGGLSQRDGSLHRHGRRRGAAAPRSEAGRLLAEASRRGFVRGRRGRRSGGHLPDGQRVQQLFAVGSVGMHATIRLAEEEPDARGLEGVRLHHQRHLPGFGKESLVNLQIGVGQKNLAARMGVIPPHRTESPIEIGVAGQQLFETRFIRRRQREGRPVGMFAIERRIPADYETCVFEPAEQNSADFRTAPRQARKTRPSRPVGYRPERAPRIRR